MPTTTTLHASVPVEQAAEQLQGDLLAIAPVVLAGAAALAALSVGWRFARSLMNGVVPDHPKWDGFEFPE